MAERWVLIPGYDGKYSVSDAGRIRIEGTDGRIMRPYVTRGGYLRVCLRQNGKKKMCLVHRLVALAFLGPSDLLVCHLSQLRLV